VTLALALVFGVVFFEVARALDLGREVQGIRNGAQGAIRMLASGASDDEKEAAMRRASLRVLAATGLLTLKFLAIGAALFALFALIVTVMPGQRQELLESLSSPTGIVIVTVGTLIYAGARHVAVKKL
jgi:hypothetical protein